MAAVAGSKGKIVASREIGNLNPPQPSFQASIASRLLSGKISTEEALDEMMPRSRLREVGIDTNMLCNLRCLYCYLDDRPVRKGELDAEAWMEFLMPLADDACKLFAFIGKEPLLDDIALGILLRLNMLRGKGFQFRTGMVTNGTQLHRHSDQLLEANLSYLDVSLDGLPAVNDKWRGEGVSETVLRNISHYLTRNPQHDLFVSSVMHKGNHEQIANFAMHLFEMGLKGFFTSPVLKFTRNQNIASWAITPPELNLAIERLLTLAGNLKSGSEHQIVVDLPYRYAWHLLATGRVKSEDVFEDQYEVPFWQPDPSLPVFVKMNVLSYSFWKAIRITHDSTIIGNLDLAAHEDYSLGANKPDRGGLWLQHFPGEAARNFHSRFFAEHLHAVGNEARLFDRAIASQHSFQKGIVGVAEFAM
jgi:MoaA/NifB/PqqE/SkfB family radical SAM enzyme